MVVVRSMVPPARPAALALVAVPVLVPVPVVMPMLMVVVVVVVVAVGGRLVQDVRLHILLYPAHHMRAECRQPPAPLQHTRQAGSTSWQNRAPTISRNEQLQGPKDCPDTMPSQEVTHATWCAVAIAHSPTDSVRPTTHLSRSKPPMPRT